MSSVWDQVFTRWHHSNQFDRSGTLLIFCLLSRVADWYFHMVLPTRKHMSERGRSKAGSDRPSKSGPMTRGRRSAITLDDDKGKFIAIYM
jgi:hypothetical protein